jgi:hypothetical protein
MAKAQPKTAAAKKVAASAAARRASVAAAPAGAAAGTPGAEPHRATDKVALVASSPIRHDGRDYDAGDALSVDPDTAVELLDAGIADFPPGTDAAADDAAA